MRREAGGRNFKRCKPHSGPSSANPAPAPASSTTPAPSADPAPTSYTAPATTSVSTGGGSSGGSSNGKVINVKTSGCGDIGATEKTSKTTGPNGSQDWLNCGLNNGGWNPPHIEVKDLIVKDLGAVMSSGNNIFKPCAPYTDIIYDAAGQYNIPAIMIASIMMQESTCNKDTVGGGGEQGLMQITKDKCGGAPGGNCKDPSYNIHTGAKYLADQINNCGGNVLEAVGTYNGWSKGLTYGKATAAAKTSCCRCQNNLDYPHQFFNGWMQNIDAYSTDLGVYKNLNVCSD
ncbi:lysozyme-like protein [Ceratobasidium sp. AG-I]|nr:lysozyme-like protein [Ceratobasidium sp. AG-I]